ncbi:MAG: 16S rRNA (cytosine(1402)-N(4))-methyltransferase RsmH [Proteobacteria bacterium]|nr:16S rRNA (cytosine(1402)-N(4))-methyltransferase RsmH [Pseudomonadota bacterium]
MNSDSGHIPVLLREVIEHIRCTDGGIYVDATTGSGGHAGELLKTCPGIALLVGIDRDARAVAIARKNLEPFHDRVMVLQGNFTELKTILGTISIHQIDGILFDLGVSSMQLNDPSRGFSFMGDGPLDMRMDQNTSVQAKDIINSSSEPELADMLRSFGEERWAKRIAWHILKRRTEGPIATTAELSDIIVHALPRRHFPAKIHPATKTFQALRIAVNDELQNLHTGLDEALDLLRPGGRLCAISFHSLEDRIVKHKLQQWGKGCTCPPRVPQCVCGGTPKVTIITRKPVVPAPAEIQANPRSRSAKLRVAEKV